MAWLGSINMIFSYVWNERDQSFEQLSGLEKNTTVSSFFGDLSHGVPRSKVVNAQQLHGANMISIEVQLVRECDLISYIY